MKWCAVLACCLLAWPVMASDDLGKQVFTKTATPPCAACHTLQAAGASAEIGPSLDDMKPDVERVLKAVRNGLGAMPRFSGLLTEEQIKAVAEYVARAAR